MERGFDREKSGIRAWLDFGSPEAVGMSVGSAALELGEVSGKQRGWSGLAELQGHLPGEVEGKPEHR